MTKDKSEDRFYRQSVIGKIFIYFEVSKRGDNKKDPVRPFRS